MSKISREIREIVNTDAMGKQDSTVGLRYKQYLEYNKTRKSSGFESLPKKSDVVRGLPQKYLRHQKSVSFKESEFQSRTIGGLIKRDKSLIKAMESQGTYIFSPLANAL